jgi:PII-like signaling protein
VPAAGEVNAVPDPSPDVEAAGIFCGESDKAGSVMLYEALMIKARETGISGCTVLRGIAGFGAASRIHTAKILRLSEDLPQKILSSFASPESFIKILFSVKKEKLLL